MKRAYRCIRDTHVAARIHIGHTFDANYRLGAYPTTVCAMVNIIAHSYLGDPLHFRIKA